MSNAPLAIPVGHYVRTAVAESELFDLRHVLDDEGYTTFVPLADDPRRLLTFLSPKGGLGAIYKSRNRGACRVPVEIYELLVTRVRGIHPSELGTDMLGGMLHRY